MAFVARAVALGCALALLGCAAPQPPRAPTAAAIPSALPSHMPTASAARATSTQVPLPTATPIPTSTPDRSGELHAQFEQIARAAEGRVGVAATLLESGETIALNGDGRFPMQSVYKLPIGMSVLRQVDQGALELERRRWVGPDELLPSPIFSPLRDRHSDGAELSLRELLQLMISESDNSASDLLLREVGVNAVNDDLRDLGIQGVVVRNSEREMARDRQVQYNNWATPVQMVELLRALHAGRGLSGASRALLLQLMTETDSGPQRIKGQLPADAAVAHKTGTSATSGGLTPATNDVGIITLPDGRHIAIAVFVSDSAADAATREAVIARIARAAWDHWAA